MLNLLLTKSDKEQIKIEVIFINGEKRFYSNIDSYYRNGNSDINIKLKDGKTISIYNADIVIYKEEKKE